MNAASPILEETLPYRI